jgi:predicted ribonuclease YlaK
LDQFKKGNEMIHFHAMNFSASNPDHHVLKIAYCLEKENPGRGVILVSKDVNLRLKAKSAVGLVSQDYTTDHVKDISELYTGTRIVEDFPEDMIGNLYESPGEIEANGRAICYKAHRWRGNPAARLEDSSYRFTAILPTGYDFRWSWGMRGLCEDQPSKRK